MKLIKFRIWNYKSIKDSGDCYVEPGITILAGKNEAGKTAILEALEDFNSNNQLREKAKPLFKKDALPEITVTFKADKKVIENALHAIGLSNKYSSDVEIAIKKSFPDTYSLTENTFSELFINKNVILEQDKTAISEIYEKIKVSLAPYPEIAKELPKLSFTDLSAKANAFTTFKETITQRNGEMTEGAERDALHGFVTDILNRFNAISDPETIKGKVLIEIVKLIPNLILFSSFEDIFPSLIEIKDVPNNAVVKDLDIISDLNLEVISKGQPSEQIKHKRQLNIRMKDEYKKYWTQDVTNLQVDWDNNQLRFFIEEDGEFYPPEVRSKGKQWHLAFYIRITARSLEEKTNVILIDEPGLFLHATAQRDILRRLESSSKKSQIIFTTHSPYLIETDKLQRVRLVQRGVIPKIIEEIELESSSDEFGAYYEKKTHKEGGTTYYKLKDKKYNEDEENQLRSLLFKLGCNIGTQIEGKIHKVADKETLTPVITAIGLELASGIVNQDKKNNVICEGQSDIYYMQAFKLLLKSNDFNFVFGGGAGNMPFVGTILSGWGGHVLYLYDNDKGKKDAEKNLRENWLVTRDMLLAVTNIQGGSIEDIFSIADCKKYVLEDESLSYTGLNSVYIKQENKDKVLLARNFLQKCEQKSVALSTTTKKNVKAILNELKNKFENEFS